MHFNQGIIDCHVHTHGGCGVEAFLRNANDHINAAGVDTENLLCVKHGPSACITEANALLAKATFPGRFTVMGNPTFQISEFDTTPEGVAEQVFGFLESGMDGVKLADVNGGIGTPLDSEIFDPMMTMLEKLDAPILYHVGAWPVAPARRVFQKNHYEVENPPFLTYQGPEDDDKPEMQMLPLDVNEIKYTQIDRMLEKHPDLKLIIPHMYHMAKDPHRLASLLEKHKNLYFDLTPGPQLYYYFSQNPKEARDFLITYSNRILFGTDNTTELDPLNIVLYERMFLETDEPFFAAAWGLELQGMQLPKEALNNIYSGTFRSLFPQRPVDKRKAARFSEEIYETIRGIETMPEANKLEMLECRDRFLAMN